MAALMYIFAIYLVYVSYFKIICILFRGKQHNRFFATFLNTVLPVFGSVPAIIVASKYERRISSPAAKMNEDVLRYIIIAMQMISVFMLFLPFFSANGEYSKGVNLIYGNSIAGSDTLKPAFFMIYLIIAPFFSAIVNIADRRFNIHNLLTYVISLLMCISLLGILLVVGMEDISATPLLWLYCIVNVTIMLLSVFSMVVVRNKTLYKIEQEEKAEYIMEQKKKNKLEEPKQIAENTYKCAKCGNEVEKGKICSCISSHPTLDRVMDNTQIPKDKRGKYCVYCRKYLNEGEVCTCQGDGFAITVKSPSYQGRKCKYCGQIVVGESTCVCEKILKNSQPSGNDPLPKMHIPSVDELSGDTSTELEELEKKINQKFSDIKSNIVYNATDDE